jgi:hypothetical protein
MGREAYLYDSLLGTFTPISQNLTLGFNSIQTTQRVSLVLKVAETTSISQTVNSTGNWYVYSNSNEYFLVNKENSKEKANITICSTDGNILLQENEAMFNNNIKQLQTENFKPGIYLLKINQKDKIQTIKFVIQ